jgi:predicted TIM-barrel fold metal-dependent hydrolase
MSAAPWSAGTADAKLALPPNSVDCHLHIYDNRFPFDPGANLRPADATVADYRLLQARLGTERCVVVQPSSYGTDNRCLVDALQQFGSEARGVAVIDANASDAELQQLDRAGVRGIRFNLARPAGPALENLESLARRVATMGWHVQLHALADTYVNIEAVLDRLAGIIVIDHLGRLPYPAGIDHPAWAVLNRLVQKGRCWIKLSGAYHDSRIGAPSYADSGVVVRAWLREAPERVVWGTDWPHPSAAAGEKPVPDDAQLLDLLGEWAPGRDLLEGVLVMNPAELYGFD